MGERRPLATRELPASKRLATSLAARGCTPNGISVAGMIAGVLGGAAFVLTAVQVDLARVWFVVGAALVQLRLLANMLDGMVAVANDLESPVGEIYNEVPDRVSDVAILVGLGYAAAGWPMLGWAAAVAAVMTAYVRAQIKVSGGPQDFGGPMAKPHRMFTVTVVALYCGLTPAAWQPPVDVVGGPAGGPSSAGLPAVGLAVIALGSVLTMLLRLRRGARALRSRA